MKSARYFSLLTAILIAASASTAALAQSTSDTGLFRLNLNDPQVRSRLEEQGAQVIDHGPDGVPCVKIWAPVVTGTKTAGFMVEAPLDIAPFRGSEIAVIAKVRGQDVTKPFQHYAGIKAQVNVESPTLGNSSINTQNVYGTFDRKEISAIGIVAADASHGSIKLGLEQCSGTVWLDDIRVKVLEKMAQRPPPVAVLNQKATQYRGMMSPSVFNEQDFKDMAAWHVNCIRWHFDYSKGKDPGEPDAPGYDAWFNGKLDEFQKVLDSAQAHGIKVVLDPLHSGGRTEDGSLKMFYDRSLEDQFVERWQRIARRFKGQPALWAYDMINEPVQNQVSPPGVDDWYQLQVRIAKAIRAIDPKTPIMFETDEWDAAAPYALLRPIPVSNIIYQVHMYWPGAFTHQGVHTNQGVAKDQNSNSWTIRYPGKISGMNVDKAMLAAQLQPVRDFQKAYNVRIFVGEFSAIRWAPGAAQYLNDLVSIFEQNGWDWTYHCFREWSGWSLEHDDTYYVPGSLPKPQPVNYETDRAKVIRDALLQNQNP